MNKRYYFDTSIWLDYSEKRGKNGKIALHLIKRIIEQGDIIIFSDMIVRELRQFGYSQQAIDELFSIAKPDHLRRIHVFEQEIEEAKKLAMQRNIPKIDAVHAVLARDNELQLISRDRHFDKLKDITKTKYPEDAFS